MIREYNTQEEILNGEIARLLRDKKLYTEADKWINNKKVDILVKNQKEDSYFTAIECKNGQSKTQKNNAIRDAMRWIPNNRCHNYIALCYPNYIKQQDLKSTDQLLFAKVDGDGLVGNWYQGDYNKLYQITNDVNTNHVEYITKVLSEAIISASSHFNENVNELLSHIMEISKEKKRPILISCLILINALLMQSRLRETSKKKQLQNLNSLTELKGSENIISTLLRDWNEIKKIDYAPVIDPAIKILKKLPTTQLTVEALKTLIKASIDCNKHIISTRLDYLGSIYHKLLNTAKHDGSFYTTIEASVLLSKLAITEEHSEKIRGGAVQNY